jgi:hypothetical protein
MAWWRRSRLVRAVVVALLLWTGADLTADLALPELCALDQEQQTTSSAPHVDDCFCCSHCVEIQAFGPALDAVPRARDFTPVSVPTPRLLGRPIYHPPLV